MSEVVVTFAMWTIETSQEIILVCVIDGKPVDIWKVKEKHE